MSYEVVNVGDSKVAQWPYPPNQGEIDNAATSVFPDVPRNELVQDQDDHGNHFLYSFIP